MRVFLAASLLLGCAGRPPQPLPPGRSAVLPPSQAAKLLEQCSRPAPRTDGTWMPPPETIAQIEADLPRLVGRKTNECCVGGARLKSLDPFLRQYLGVTIAGRRYIYVNAFPATDFEDLPPSVPIPSWRDEAVVACDGGTGYWGVLYDPARRRFSELAFNGIGG